MNCFTCLQESKGGTMFCSYKTRWAGVEKILSSKLFVTESAGRTSVNKSPLREIFSLSEPESCFVSKRNRWGRVVEFCEWRRTKYPWRQEKQVRDGDRRADNNQSRSMLKNVQYSYLSTPTLAYPCSVATLGTGLVKKSLFKNQPPVVVNQKKESGSAYGLTKQTFRTICHTPVL